MEELVTVIIPNYNHARYLPQRIDSVLNQTYRNIEVILLDDCSADDSAEVMKRYFTADPRVKACIINEKNSGSTFLQWQKGFNLAHGKYIWIAESDDYADATFLEKLVAKAEAHHAVLAFSRSVLVDQNNNPLHHMQWDYPHHYHNDGVYDGWRYARARMLLMNRLYNASMILFRRDALAKVDEGYKEFRFCGDWYFWTNVAIQGTIVEVPEKLNYYRQHTDKVSVRITENGNGFKEEAKCKMYLLKKLRISKIEEMALRLKSSRKLKNVSAELRDELRALYPKIYAAGALDWAAHQLSKLLPKAKY